MPLPTHKQHLTPEQLQELNRLYYDQRHPDDVAATVDHRAPSLAAADPVLAAAIAQSKVAAYAIKARLAELFEENDL